MIAEPLKRRVLGTLDAVKVFPLPDVVLFPGALVPLHVFEPRYHRLVSDALAGDRVLAVATLSPGWENAYEEAPPVHPVCGAGVVVAEERLDDGRMNVLVHGVARVRILAFTQREPYRLACVQWLPERPLDDDPGARLLRHEGVSMLDCLERLLTVLQKLGVDASFEVEPNNPSEAADLIAAQVVMDPSERIALLETTDPAERVRRVTGALSEILLRVEAAAEEAGDLPKVMH